ncbi:hypothetical protein OK351_08450 [Glutamicibacter sp. MNS18]|uniref:hypothetical protein n=1 Tax=Glutamicibacter sp. MNS18 TaxID=2989817 RepID=UPI002235BFB7|nr:hypothetical protein [Glutamicibacter sp. MNS18]MCW4465532.1 hypothetical protein [Glutamicibacter sp. MNS18]
MGYEINYNPEDYAQAAAACRAVALHSRRAQTLFQQCLMRAIACRIEARVRANAAGLSPWLPALHDFGTQLQDLIQLSGQRESEAVDLATKVEQAIINATETERKVRAMIALLRTPGTLMHGFTGARENNWRPPRNETERLLELLAVLANVELLPWNATDPLGSPVQDVMQRFAEVLDTQNLLPRQPIVIDQIQDLAPIPMDGTLDSYYRLQDLSRQEDSRILIGRTRSEGREVFLVIVPGTQPHRGDGNPFDPRGIMDSLGHDSNNYAEAFAKALEFSGAHEGSEVVLSGHSQGGIHIANLAKHPLLRNKFKIKTVLTLGSPIGPMTLPQDVKSLHLEDETDPVPGMDGMPNKRKRQQITVTFPEPSDPESLDSEGFGKGHQLENYRDHLEHLQNTPNPELAPIINSLMFAPGPMKLKSFRLRRRKKEPAPTPKREDEHYRKLSGINPPH